MRRTIFYLVLITMLITIGLIGYFNKPVNYPDEALNRAYYKYSLISDDYEDITIKKESITYNGTILNIDGCKTYTYDKDTGVIKMDCGKTMRIVYATEQALVINAENQNYYYFADKEEAHKKGINQISDETINEFKNEAKEKLNKVKIGFEELSNFLNGEEKSYVLIRNNNNENNCLYVGYDIDYILTGKTVYYVDSSDLNEEMNTLINNYNENILKSEDAAIVEMSNGEISNAFYINLGGFDNLRGYLDDKVVEGEE